MEWPLLVIADYIIRKQPLFNIVHFHALPHIWWLGINYARFTLWVPCKFLKSRKLLQRNSHCVMHLFTRFLIGILYYPIQCHDCSWLSIPYLILIILDAQIENVALKKECSSWPIKWREWINWSTWKVKTDIQFYTLHFLHKTSIYFQLASMHAVSKGLICGPR